MTVGKTTIQNRMLRLSIDASGRIISLYNKRTKTELITYPSVSDIWRIVIPTGRHTLAFVYGSQHTPTRVFVRKSETAKTLEITYEGLEVQGRRAPINLRLFLSLVDETGELQAWAEIDNKGSMVIDEVEFPIVGGMAGYRAGKTRNMHLVAFFGTTPLFCNDVLTNGLPDTGRASNHFAREHETAMIPCWGDTSLWGHVPIDCEIKHRGAWLDLWRGKEGLYAGFHPQESPLFAFKLEKYPKEVPNAPTHNYPRCTQRWVRLHCLHMPRIAPGGTWKSEPVTLLAHEGDWHVGADRYAAYRRPELVYCDTPVWMKDFVGWTEIVGKLYTGEIFHDYRRCAEMVVRDARITGLNVVFYYGHTKLGAEGADFDNGPAEDLGGETGFRAMVETLHRHGIRIMLLDHFHRWVNRDVPEYDCLGLERYAVLSKGGTPVTARWWKETGLSCLYHAGPTPTWVEMCPSCKEWREYYIRHVERMIELGVDGLELDTFYPSICYNPAHPHKSGASMFSVKLDFMREVRQRAKHLNPHFALFAEAWSPEVRTVMDGLYPHRFLDETGRLSRYLFPEVREQPALVGNYAYDQVNKALQFGIGVDTEIWGLRKTCAEACPELAHYILSLIHI